MQRAWAILRKDLLVERRSKATFNAVAFLGVTVLLIFSFAVGADRDLLARSAPGLLWVAILLAGMLGLGRTFDVELEAGGMDALRIYPGAAWSVYLGKMLGALAITLAMEAILVPMAAVLYGMDLWPHLPALSGVLLLGTLGFVELGTFYAALTVDLRAREVMLPLLALPVLAPVVLGSVKATGAVLTGDPFGELRTWVGLLAAFDIVFLTVCTLGFEHVIEE